MLPDIGIMIGTYIAFRCIETFCLSASRYTDWGTRLVTFEFAMVTLLMTAFVVWDLLLSGSHTSVPAVP
jgi:hypothetical protein